MNEWPFLNLSLFTCVNAQRETTLKRNVYKVICLDNYDSLHNWHVSFYDRKILPLLTALIRRSCCDTYAKILGLANKTPPQSTMLTGSEHVVGPCNAPLLTHQNYVLNADCPPRIPSRWSFVLLRPTILKKYSTKNLLCPHYWSK